VTFYVSVEQLLRLHARQVERFGGSPGLRDRGGLESAAARPAMTFGGDDLFPDLAAKAAALMHSLVTNHPFVDGNKRLGASAAELFLVVNGAGLNALDAELEETTMSVARGEMEVEPLTIWFRQRIVRRD
jgi:death-on-curing protein